MTRSRLFLLSFLVLAGCDKTGVYHYGVLADVIEPCGPRSSVLLRSVPADTVNGLDSRTEIVILGSIDPVDTVPPAAPGVVERCFLQGYVERSSSTFLRYGTYELDGAGVGVAHVQSTYIFDYEPQKPVSGRMGAQRYDDPFDIPFTMARGGTGYDFDFEGTNRRMETLTTVLDAIDASTPEGMMDVFQLYNISLFFSQVRVPSFGGIGMTRYISSPTAFNGLISGEFYVKVNSLSDPTTTIEYRPTSLEPTVAFQDFPSIQISGRQVTRVNIMGDGDMVGALAFEFHDSTDPSIVRFAGTLDYGSVNIGNGVASGGTYTLDVTTPVTNSAVLPYTVASNVDLSHALPPSP